MKSDTNWPKHVFLIAAGEQQRHHRASPKHLGFKAYNLLRMAEIGLRVPPALVLGTHFAHRPEACMAPLYEVGLPALQQAAGLVFGEARNPLIVSVRSGAPVSMPGMMETLLNIGLCDATLPGMLRQFGNPRLVWDAYRRLVASYGEVVAGIDAALFEAELGRLLRGRDERELDFAELRELTTRFLAIYRESAGRPFPHDPKEQLSGAVRAVFASWDSDKAKTYRKLNGIDSAMGTAVTIQRMVFGNTGRRSGAGVGFTRDPSSGDAQLWVDFLANAQGEDVVSGRRNAYGRDVLAAMMPEAWHRLEESAQALEREFADMQDFEFTVQDGELYMLQTRTGKRTALARARIALDLLDQGIIDQATALERTGALKEKDIGTVRLAQQGGQSTAAPLATAVAACPGVASGEIVFDGERAVQRAKHGANLILVRQDAETGDIAAMDRAVGMLTQRGARTSHAAVVARQLGLVCLVGCEALQIDMAARKLRFGDAVFKEGDVLTLDGNEGAVHAGKLVAAMVPDKQLLGRLRALRKASLPAPT